MTNRVLTFLMSVLLVSGVGRIAHAQPYERTVRDTISFTPQTVSVENQGGSITVSTWSKDRVAYKARIVSEQSDDVMEEVSIDVDQFNQELSLVSNVENVDARWAFGPEIFGYGVPSPEVHYTLTIPKTSDLTIQDQESDIEISGLAAALSVRTEEGSLRVSNQKGPVQIDSQEGATSLTNVRGDLHVDTREGTLSVEALRGQLLLDTYEGRAEVSIDSLGAADVENHEGIVTLNLPSDAGFDLATDLGEDAVLESAAGMDSYRTEEGNYHGSLQGGGPLFHLTSQEGRIVLRRR